ncbi:hypothetical protein HanRHA438_Chr14g0675531 [Helianthus annuus]|uniref:Putative membrane lipoprotein n=1 Tax=Helianthus annuus TaxID=4232 RepID=A0A251SL73_HELAN|nr:uncharacterized protein LOC110904758 [Helianthus annuus]KAF5770875.1 hypothetical protein HanXRQr2_Chr14g0664281 [Helianthus annuus]KAJ0465738.1 hypothetical protein HanHA300_Chr14g0541451 [Helianthus annuus]KAJ0470632.1 hypothetical protein HanIR_Chr14g0720851 [Helianthus annuus]KAJ0487332.1 hypothetical protein HanHA89_Chr14g0589231 [Helianthus annuus]KAJ0661443.1 hypothetical protein HanOQP8_Chr14g0548571 [Helianthus annuus]
MRSSSSVGLGLSLVFGCLLLALIAELYYLLWCKKRVSNRDIEESYSSPAREFLYLFCWKKPSSLTSTGLTTDTQVHEPQAPSWLRPVGRQEVQDCDDMTIETEVELLRLQNLSGPPRFLFTIKEETKEDLESEDKSKRGSRGRSLSDDVFSVDTPFFTPLASPPYLTPPITPRDSTHRPFSPLSYSSSDAEFNRIWASPPPKFKFLRDAEDKLQKRILSERFGVENSVKKGDENGSFITLIVSKDKEIVHQCPSSSSQVLPLAASPPTFRPHFHKNFSSQ